MGSPDPTGASEVDRDTQNGVDLPVLLMGALRALGHGWESLRPRATLWG